MKPAHRSNTPRMASAINKSEAMIIMLKVLRVLHSDVCIVANKAGTPNTNRMFAVFDPTTLPRAIPGALSNTALIDTSSSGADVPKATIVRLTIKAGTPRRRDRFTAPFTSASPASNKITSPKTLRTQGIIIRVYPRIRRGISQCDSVHNCYISSGSDACRLASAFFRTMQACPWRPETIRQF